MTQKIHDIFAEILGIKSDFESDISFIELGGTSILIGELKSRLDAEFHVDIPFEKMFESGSVCGLAEQIELLRKNVITDDNAAAFEVHPEKRFDVFKMTDLQTAYYIGRQNDTELGGSPTRGYSEIICENYDHRRMEQAIRKLIAKHDTLRTHFNEDGTQQVEAEFGELDFELEDISDMQPDAQQEYLLEKRERIFDTVFDVHHLPLVSFAATKCAPDKTIIHFSHDGMIIDGWSHEKIIGELDKFYTDTALSARPPEILFSDYVRYLEEIRDTDKFRADREYWLQKASDKFSRPALPLKTDPGNIRQVRTRQVIRYISRETWNGVAEFAGRNELTPFSVIFTVFGKSILKYCRDKQCVINMPVAVRPHIHPDIGELIGECSNFFLFDLDDTQNRSFIECASENQKKIAEIMQHDSFFGTDIIRELQKKDGANVAAPIVFTSLIDIPAREEHSLKKTYTKTHTSQVWIDAIAMKNTDGIMLTMDCAADLFEPELTDAIGDTFKETLEKICDAPELFEKGSGIGLTQKEQETVKCCTSADLAADDGLPSLAELLIAPYRTSPERTAVISKGKEYSYKLIYRTAASAANQLRSAAGGISTTGAAVFLRKSHLQIVSALACTMCGTAYFPLDIEMPAEQLKACTENAGTKVILTETALSEKLSGLNGVTVILVDKVEPSDEEDVRFTDTSPNDIAYIINTSGTTGLPKSIPLKQSGLVNCLTETRSHCGLTPDDRFLAITNYCHDMSVFDMYGAFAAGAAVVFPDAEREKDPYHWAELIFKYNVTFWNSVPAFLQILTEADIEDTEQKLASVRNILTGGDWISATLAKKIRVAFKNAVLCSVGGPSETTIWNIRHVVTDEDIRGTFIPYGKPIAHTNYYILDERGELCPPFTAGTMFVGGIGVTDGYIGLPEENRKRFRTFDGVRVYDTGDLGMYLSDGSVKILGRTDLQVKINGKRIELEGIQEALNSISGIESSAVIVSDKRILTAFYTSEHEIELSQLKDALKQKLPSYMIPVNYHRLDAMPLTKNGKVDTEALKGIAVHEQGIETPEKSDAESHDTETEAVLLSICRDIFNGSDITSDMNFFEMGGDSITAIRILGQIRKKFGVTLTIYDILNTPLLSQWALIIDRAERVR